MALVSCTECGRDVSDKAAACVGCGAPIGAAPVRAAVSGKVEVEATGRRYKNQMIMAVLMLLFGCVLLFANSSMGASVFGTLVALAGLLLWLKARFSAWYNNG
jgi:uncharacterized membrane protein YvbJ